jgi:hypothetical protein
MAISPPEVRIWWNQPIARAELIWGLNHANILFGKPRVDVTKAPRSGRGYSPRGCRGLTQTGLVM